MKCLSIDIETTGLDPDYCQILELGLVAFDTKDFDTQIDELPSLNIRFYYDKIVGEPIALAMNAQLIAEMPKKEGQYPWHDISTLYEHLIAFKHLVFKDEKVTMTGKNLPTFDLRFLEKTKDWKTRGEFHRRLYDPAIYFFDRQLDELLPDTKLCIERAGLEWDTKRLHSAVWDARLMVALIRKGLKK